MPLPALALPLALTVTPPHLKAARTTEKITLDGRLDEGAWRLAPVTEELTQKFPTEGKAPTQPTRIRVLYDDDAIYVAIDCVQTGVPIVAPLTRRDRKIESDWVSVGFDTRRDGTSGFEFTVNAAGVLADGIYFNDTDFSDQWDENWEAKVATNDHGWSVEMRIPLRILRFDELAKQSWGMQVRRYTSARQETDEWAFTSRGTAGEVSHYGKLDDLEGLTAKSQFELRPFLVGRIRHFDSESDAVARGWDAKPNFGLDLKWHITQNLTLDATVNPDFGQVEADQVVLNLSNFEVYFPEKRTFFLEGVDSFATPMQLLYTRRIGHAAPAPALRLDPPFNEQLYKPPEPTTIWGAAKLTGELGSRWSVGELLAITGSESTSVLRSDGTIERRVSDPLTTYKVLRLKRAFGENSHIGVIAMATNHLDQSKDNVSDPADVRRLLCPSGDSVKAGQRCNHDAYVAGIDGRWRSPSGDYVLAAQAIATSIQGGVPRTFADGTEVKSGDVAPGLTVTAAKEGGKDWVGHVDYEMHGRRLDYNDLGYMQRQNLHHIKASLGYRTLEPKWVTNETNAHIGVVEEDNLDLVAQNRILFLTGFVLFKNYWGIYHELNFRAARYDDREMGDGAALERQALFSAEVYGFTDPRKPVSVEAWTQVQARGNGWQIQSDGGIAIRAVPALEVNIGPQALYTVGEPRAVSSNGTDYLFGRQRAEELGVTLRATYTFTPTLTLQTYAQLFLASEHYFDFSSYPVWNGQGSAPIIHLEDLKTTTVPRDFLPDFEEGALNANVVLRWEYRLGSTLYVVYSHAQDKTVTPFFGEDGGLNLRLVKPHAASDVFLTKLSYWWG